MSKIPRRRKLFSIDGAEFIVAPLSHDELIKYGEMEEEFNKLKPDLAKLTPEQHELARKMTRYAICCGLNGVNPDAEPVTSEDIGAQMDDVLSLALWREIFKFTGITLPTDSEIKQRIATGRPEGETQASS